MWQPLWFGVAGWGLRKVLLALAFELRGARAYGTAQTIACGMIAKPTGSPSKPSGGCGSAQDGIENPFESFEIAVRQMRSKLR
jgi:hypothetical protein